MIVDFREAKEVAKEVSKELTEKDSNWKCYSISDYSLS